MYVVGRGGSDHIVVGFTTNYAINVSHQMQVCHRHWSSPVSSNNEYYRHNITEILWNVALNTITLSL
jgi:hypothetical protein